MIPLCGAALRSPDFSRESSGREGGKKKYTGMYRMFIPRSAKGCDVSPAAIMVLLCDHRGRRAQVATLTAAYKHILMGGFNGAAAPRAAGSCFKLLCCVTAPNKAGGGGRNVPAWDSYPSALCHAHA